LRVAASAKPAQIDAPTEPVFLHALWRSGSTYVWSRFREAPGTRAFYDPLNIDLAKLTAAKIARITPAASPHLRHPLMDEPYFAEFAPLLAGKGVHGYSRDLAVERMFLDPEEPHPALEVYLRQLIDRGGAEDLAPVLGLTGSFGRIGWAKARFGGRHIHIDRSAEAIWGSYMDQIRAGNPWFIARLLPVIEANRAHPWLQPLAEAMPLRTPLQKLMGGRKEHYRRVAAQIAPEEVYRLVFHVWTLAALQGLVHCQAILDMNLVGEPRYRAGATRAIRSLTGLDVNFDDAQAASAKGPMLDRGLKRRIEGEVLRSIPLSARHEAVQAGAAKRLANLAPAKADLLSTLF
jgi:hypothetical protein